MIKIKTASEIKLMEEAGKINYQTHQLIKKHIKEGITTAKLNEIALDFIKSKGCIPSFLGYQGFPGAICTSINEEVVHGIPGSRKLKNGDIISIDIGVIYKGYHSDSANTYAVGNISTKEASLLKYTEESLYAGISVIKEGMKLSEISKKIEKVALDNNLGIVKELVGHGVGKKLHEEPNIPNYYTSDYEDVILKEGMVLAIEPMLTSGKADIWMLDDDWTIVTQDNSKSAHYEHSVLVTKSGYKILTKE